MVDIWTVFSYSLSLMIYVKTQQEFKKEVLDVKDGSVLVDFFAVWCGPCQMMEPVLENFAKANPKVKVVKVNVDEAQELAMQYNVMSIPTMYVFKSGEVVGQPLMGVQSEANLQQATK